MEDDHREHAPSEPPTTSRISRRKWVWTGVVTTIILVVLPGIMVVAGHAQASGRECWLRYCELRPGMTIVEVEECLAGNMEWRPPVEGMRSQLAIPVPLRPLHYTQGQVIMRNESTVADFAVFTFENGRTITCQFDNRGLAFAQYSGEQEDMDGQYFDPNRFGRLRLQRLADSETRRGTPATTGRVSQVEVCTVNPCVGMPCDVDLALEGRARRRCVRLAAAVCEGAGAQPGPVAEGLPHPDHVKQDEPLAMRVYAAVRLVVGQREVIVMLSCGWADAAASSA